MYSIVYEIPRDKRNPLTVIVEGDPLLSLFKEISIEGNPLLYKEIPYYRRNMKHSHG